MPRLCALYNHSSKRLQNYLSHVQLAARIVALLGICSVRTKSFLHAPQNAAASKAASTSSYPHKSSQSTGSAQASLSASSATRGLQPPAQRATARGRLGASGCARTNEPKLRSGAPQRRRGALEAAAVVDACPPQWRPATGIGSCAVAGAHLGVRPQGYQRI